MICRGGTVEQRRSVKVHHHGLVIGEYGTHLLVENALLVDLKTAKELGLGCNAPMI